MKSKLINPRQNQSEFKQANKDTEHSTFKYPFKGRTERKHRVNTRKYSPIRYMWESSIPETWFRLAESSSFMNIRAERKNSRNTLQFLEETQKYIYNIRQPLLPEHTMKKVTKRSSLSTDSILVKPLPMTLSFKNLRTKGNTLIGESKKKLISKISSIDRFKLLFDVPKKLN